MATRDRCLNCGGYPNDTHRLTIPRAKSGDLIFCGLFCWRAWDGRRLEADEDG
jgi:hypothetical protein